MTDTTLTLDYHCCLPAGGRVLVLSIRRRNSPLTSAFPTPLSSLTPCRPECRLRCRVVSDALSSLVPCRLWCRVVSDAVSSLSSLMPCRLWCRVVSGAVSSRVSVLRRIRAHRALDDLQEFVRVRQSQNKTARFIVHRGVTLSRDPAWRSRLT